MNKVSIIALVFIALTIAVLISFMGSLSTYATVQTAKSQPGTFVHLVAKLDRRQPIVYDAIGAPNYLSFTAIDTLGHSVKVVYRSARPDNLETSERLVLKGAMKGDHFECEDILVKCPSKYKDDKGYVNQSPPYAGDGTAGTAQ